MPRTYKSGDLVTVAAVTVAAAATTIGGCVAFLGYQVAKRRRKFNTPQRIDTPGVPLPHGHFSQAMTHRGKVYVSELHPFILDAHNPYGTSLSNCSFGQQAQCLLSNLETLLVAAGSKVSKLLRLRVYISNLSNIDEFHKLLSKLCGDGPRPALCVVPLPELRFGSAISLEAVAAL